MGLLKWMLATAMVLDVALVMTGTVRTEATSPDQSVGYAVENTGYASLLGLTPNTR